MKILNFVQKITKNHYLIIGLAFLIGLVFPTSIVWAAPYTTLILMGIFFLSSLKIDLKNISQQLDERKRTIVIITIFMLLVLPVVVYYLFSFFSPALAIAFLILAAMPVGMTASLLTEISGGKPSLALILTITTSLLAPFTVPLIITTLAGTSVSVGFWSMFKLLAIVIYIPFFTAQFCKKICQKKIDKVSGFFESISTILLGILIMIIIAKQAEVIIGSFSCLYVGLLFLFFIFLHLIGYFLIPWLSKINKLTVSVCVTYLNFTLAIEVADKFFTDPNVISLVVLSVIPWSVMFIPFKRLIARKK
ncbi:MAG: bile acid:sodium symporter [Patescibacteria group bacterium]|nr:bile acid:sodium symporter [Patescibacteria group bacterium]